MAGRQFNSHTSLLGYVIELHPEDSCFKLRLRSKDNTGHDLIYAYLNKEVWYRPLPNLHGSYDCYGAPDGYNDGKIADKMKKYLALGALVLVEGVVHRDHLANKIEVRTVFLLYDQQGKQISESKGNLVIENPQWWVDMIDALGNTWFNNFFADGTVDFTRYRTDLNELFQPKTESQEVAVLSRLLYGYSVAYQLTGKEKYLTALREGVKYQRDTFRYSVPGGKYVLWCSYYDGTNAHLPSNSGDDSGTIPLYEQIYALAGMTMFYRITGDLETLQDIFATVDAFDHFFLDKSAYGGYFSHLEPCSLKPDAESLGINKAKKNWNSVGDHVPAYLINLICALQGKPEFQDRLEKLETMLIHVTEDIITHFPTPAGDPNDTSKLVRERFYQDWSYDDTYSWQQDRGIIGHNLKIAWNLTRVAFHLGSEQADLRTKCLTLARTLAVDMDEIGGIDKFRGGCFDCVERNPKPGYDLEFTWLSTKDFWQQEQGILCYLIQMATANLEPDYLTKCRELAAAMSVFYCAFFVDTDRGGIYFRVTDSGVPIMTGMYADKGGHAKSGYHNFENAYLAHIYNAMYNNHNAITLHFAPIVPADGNIHLAIAPDFLPKDAVDFGSENTRAEIVGNGMVEPITQRLTDFNLDVSVPDDLKGTQLKVQVTLQPPEKIVGPLDSPPPPTVGKKGTIGVIIESHFDEIEVQYLQEKLPKEGYGVELISYLWGSKMLEFQGNECHDPMRVYKDINSVNLDDYVAFFFVGAYCMDRLRYETVRTADTPNKSPVVQLIKKIAAAKKTTAVICHSLWAFVCANKVLKGMKVTCSHNILDDVENAGATVMYGGADGGTIETYEDDWLVSGKQGGYIVETTDVLLKKLKREL